jgi:hypothetical protein
MGKLSQVNQLSERGNLRSDSLNPRAFTPGRMSTTNAYYGDGTPIQPEDINTIRQFVWNDATVFPRHQGDVLMLDNRLVAHGRKAFKGERRILVAMT